MKIKSFGEIEFINRIKNRLQMRNNAFTLLELLVVIVIVGLLAAMLVPALGRARENARRAQCASNLRQIGIAWYLYLDEHDGWFPDFGDPARATEFGGKGIDETDALPLNPYLDVYSAEDKAALEVFHCPSDRGETGYGESYFDTAGTSYMANLYLMGGVGLSAETLSSITAPYSKLWLTEELSGRFHGPENNQRMNVLFLDGHVKIHNFYADWNSGEVLTDPTP